ncbi:MAG: hypothetical protein AAB365_02240 [Patescibacteria group bacterium]
MNSINTEEVERLMRVVSEPLRHSWEAKNNHGSLRVLQKSWNQALIDADRYSKKEDKWETWSVVGAVTVLISAWIFGYLMKDQSMLIRGLFLAVILGACGLIFLRVNYYERKIKTVLPLIQNGNTVFGSFKKSVDALNPLGTGNSYHDVVTDKVVRERLVSLAYRTLDAQAGFDKSRLIPEACRYDIIHSGQWIEKCENWFDQVWNVATQDFALVFDKTKIFEDAAAELARSNAARKA